MSIILPVNPTTQDLLFFMLVLIHGEENVVEKPKVGNVEFIAAVNQTMFDMVDMPDKIDVNKINRALINHYTVEIIYFVPGNATIIDKRISYRYIAEYLPLLGSKTDVIRLINEARNRIEHGSRNKTRKAYDTNVQLCARTARSQKGRSG